MSVMQSEVYNQFSATFSPPVIKKWEDMIATWEANPSAPNPYAEPENGKSVLSHSLLSYVTELYCSHDAPGCQACTSVGKSCPSCPWQASAAQDKFIGILTFRV